MRYYEDLERISVHVSESGPIKNLQVFLRDNGFSFDAEGDVTRIHFDGSLLEVREEPGVGLAILFTFTLWRRRYPLLLGGR